jgi:hypothetical protein
MNKTQPIDETLQTQIQTARTAAELADQSEPRADSAYYDRHSDRIIIHLKNGATYSFSPSIAQGLANATPEDLAQIEITPAGDGLHWETIRCRFQYS